jgi:uncharacterized repeat protein (TIGR03803 family)
MRWKSCSTTKGPFAVLTAVLTLAAYSGAATATVVYNFRGSNDGSAPVGVVLVKGRLYGTAARAGAYNHGTVFELVHTKSGWAERTLYSFTGGADGGNPGPLAADKSGNLYGVSSGGPDGSVFELSRGSGGGWRFTVIHEFMGIDGDGPEGLNADDPGSLYGVTEGGGGTGCVYDLGCGTVFELSAAGHGKWKLTTLHRFDGKDGFNPEAPMYRDAKGDLYGTTEGGGGRGCPYTLGCGTVFELSPSGSGWKFSVLHRFAGGSDDGCGPLGSLAMDGEGALYGATGLCGLGSGIVYRLAQRSGRWQESVLHEFGKPPDAQLPAGVVLGSDGLIYGATAQGGSFYDGAIFELKRSGGDWTESVPFSFDGSDGYDPLSLVSGGRRKYYGTTSNGGNGPCPGGCGVVFEFVP